MDGFSLMGQMLGVSWDEDRAVFVVWYPHGVFFVGEIEEYHLGKEGI